MIEIDGLEGMWIHKSLYPNSGWKQVQKVAFNTTSHKSFEKQVKGQTKYDVYYFKFGGEAAANGYEFSVKSFNEYKSLKYETDNGKQILNQSGYGYLLKDISDKSIEKLTNNDKGIIFIGINEKHLNNANATELSNAAAYVLHEEGSHAENDLNGEQTTTAEDHTEYYNNEEENWSPSNDAVRTHPNYNNSRAKRDITETDENAKKEYETQ